MCMHELSDDLWHGRNWGYTANATLTAPDKLILAGFDCMHADAHSIFTCISVSAAGAPESAFNNEPLETFIFNQSKESKLLYTLHDKIFPKWVYWNKAVKGATWSLLRGY